MKKQNKRCHNCVFYEHLGINDPWENIWGEGFCSFPIPQWIKEKKPKNPEGKQMHIVFGRDGERCKVWKSKYAKIVSTIR